MADFLKIVYLIGHHYCKRRDFDLRTLYPVFSCFCRFLENAFIGVNLIGGRLIYSFLINTDIQEETSKWFSGWPFNFLFLAVMNICTNENIADGKTFEQLAGD